MPVWKQLAPLPEALFFCEWGDRVAIEHFSSLSAGPAQVNLA